MRQVVLSLLAGLVVVALVFVGGSALLSDKAGDAGGEAFSEELVRAAQDGALKRATVLLSDLTRFDWDEVWIAPPYDSKGIKDLVGRDADEVPTPGEFESIFVFALDGRLAAWVRADKRLGDRMGVDVRSCLYVERPLSERSGVRIVKDQLVLTDELGRQRSDLGGTCQALEED